MAKKTKKPLQERIQKALLEPSLGRRLQAVRKALDLTGADVVAQIPGLNRSTLSEIENDVSKRTSYLAPLAGIYGLSPETLLRPDLGSIIHEETIGERIRRRREELNYTRGELATEIQGLTYHALFMIEERGRQSDLIPRIVEFLGLNRADEETNSSALLRLMRTDLFLDSTDFCRIAGCDVDVLRQAEDGDTAAAVKIILDLSQGLLQAYQENLPVEETIPSIVYDVDDSGRVTLAREESAHVLLSMPDGQQLQSVPGDPEDGGYAMAIAVRNGLRSGIVGTYVRRQEGASIVDRSNISHQITQSTSLHRLVPAQETVTA